MSSLSVPKILCAFDRLLEFPDEGMGGATSFSFVDGLLLRPGKGNENLEVRPIVCDESEPSHVGYSSPAMILPRFVTATLENMIYQPNCKTFDGQVVKLPLSLRHCSCESVWRKSGREVFAVAIAIEVGGVDGERSTDSSNQIELKLPRRPF